MNGDDIALAVGNFYLQSIDPCLQFLDYLASFRPFSRFEIDLHTSSVFQSDLVEPIPPDHRFDVHSCVHGRFAIAVGAIPAPGIPQQLDALGGDIVKVCDGIALQ